MENLHAHIINYLLTQSWQIAVLAMAIAVVSLAVKNKSAHVRYLLWLIVLAKCLVPSLLTISLAVLPERRVAEPVVTSPVEMPVVTVEVVDVVPVEPVTLPPVPAVRQPPAKPSIRERLAAVTLRQWLAFVWLVGVGVFVLVAVIKALRVNRWLRRARKTLPAKLQSGIEKLFAELGVRTVPKVWLVEGIGQPFVWGLVRGSIYLPANFVGVEGDENRRGVLGHELSHILRFDAAVNLLQIIAQAVYWFHPFVWWANKKIRAEREKCCDEMAIARLGAKAKDYSTAIVNTLIAEHEATLPIPSLAVAGPVKNIEDRIKTIMSPGKRFYRRPSLIAAITVLVLALIAVPTTLALTARKAKAPEKMDLEVKGEGAWGVAVEGLQLGLAFDGEERPYRQGELVSFRVYVRNVGEKEVLLAYDDLHYSAPGLQGSEEKPMILTVHFIGGGGRVRRYRELLRPDDMKMLGKVELQIEPTLGERKAEYSGELELGQYPVRQTVKFGSASEEDCWRGDLTSGELELVVEGMRFGPVVEQIMRDEGEQACIDFDTGRTFAPYMEVYESSVRTSFRLCRKQGIDAFAEDELPGLEGISLKAVRLDESDWDSLGPAELAKMVEDRHNRIKRVKERGYGIVKLIADRPRSTFGFRTREGSIGILQIIDFMEDPWRTKIRYKMIAQGARAEARVAGPAAREMGVVGRVLDRPGGRGVAAVKVKLWSDWTRQSWFALTNEKGNYRFDDIEPGPYILRVADPPAGVWTEGVAVLVTPDPQRRRPQKTKLIRSTREGDRIVEVGTGPGQYRVSERRAGDTFEAIVITIDKQQQQRVDLYQQLPQGISGTVRDKDTGQPVAGATVNFLAIDRLRRSVRTDSEGRYRLYVPPWTIPLHCKGTAEQFCPVEMGDRDIKVGQGEYTENIDFLVRSAPSFTGQVVFADGSKAPEGVEVRAYLYWHLREGVIVGCMLAWTEVQYMKTDESGAFMGYFRVPDHLQDSERYEVLVTACARTPDASKGGAWSVTTEAANPNVGEMKIVLEKTGSAEFRVVGPDGQGATGLEVICEHWVKVNDGLRATVTEIGGGRYRAGRLIPGLEYRCWVQAKDYRQEYIRTIKPIVVRPGQHVQAPDIELEWWGKKVGIPYDLGRTGSDATEAVPTLLEVLKKSTDEPAIYRTAEALGKIGVASKPVIKALIELLENKRGSAANAAAEALGHLGAVEAIGPIEAALNAGTIKHQIGTTALWRIKKAANAKPIAAVGSDETVWGEVGTSGLSIRLVIPKREGEALPTLTPDRFSAKLEVRNIGDRPIKLAEQNTTGGREMVVDDWLIGLYVSARVPGQGVRQFLRADDQDNYWSRIGNAPGMMRIKPDETTSFGIQLRRLVDYEGTNLLSLRRRCELRPVLEVSDDKFGLWHGTAAGEFVPVIIGSEEDVERTARIADLIERATNCMKQQRYEEALAQLEMLLALEPLNEEALTLKRKLEDMISHEPSVSWRHAAVYKQLDEIVELSGWRPEVSFSKALEGLKNLVEPPLKIVVLWGDLAENADIEQSTQINIGPLPPVRLSFALELLLKSVSSGLAMAEVGYAVKDGVITIATVDSLPSKLETRVYDIALLVGPPLPGGYGGYGGYGATFYGKYRPGAEAIEKTNERAKEIAKLIEETIEPDSWRGAGGEAVIKLYENRQLIVLQTRKVHQKIEKLLKNMQRPGLGEAGIPRAGGIMPWWQATRKSEPNSAVQIESRFILLSSDCNEIGDLLAELEDSGVAPIVVEPNLRHYLLSDEQRVRLLKLIKDDPNCGMMLAAPKVTVLSGESAALSIQTQTVIALPPAVISKILPKAGAKCRTFSPTIPSGITLSVTPIITPDKENILLSLSVQMNSLLGMKSYVMETPLPDGTVAKYEQELPQIETTSVQTRVSVPGGGTLLLGGQKIETVSVQTRVSIPDGGILLLAGQKVKSKGEQDGQIVEKDLLIFIKAEIVDVSYTDSHACPSGGGVYLAAPPVKKKQGTK